MEELSLWWEMRETSGFAATAVALRRTCCAENTVDVAGTALDAACLGLFLSSLLLLGAGDFDRRTIFVKNLFF